MATQKGRGLCFPVSDITLVRNPGKGIYAVRIQGEGDAIVAAELSSKGSVGPIVMTPRGREISIHPRKYKGTRAGKGTVIIKRGALTGWEWTTQRYDLHNKQTSEDLDSDSSTEDGKKESSETAQTEGTKEVFENVPLPFMSDKSEDE